MSHPELVIGQDVLRERDVYEAIELELQAWNLKGLLPTSPYDLVVGKCPGEYQLMKTFTERNTTASCS
jgi:hypothetical protein